MSSPLKQNTNTIESILETINALPEQKGDPILQNKTVTPTKETQTVTADSNYDALNSVTVNGDANLVAANIAEGVSIFGVEGSHTGGVELPELTNPGTAADLLSGKELIDENGEVVAGTIVTKTASDLTAGGATVTVPAGYYASQATKSISTATQATPSISVSSAGLITASATQTAGYVAAGTKSATKQLTTQAAKTITPSTSSQTAVAKNVYTTGAVTVAAIPSNYVQPTATKTATTYTPSTANQTIAAGTYCSGVQTIKGDANLIAANIAEGVSIFGVTGTHSGGSSGGAGFPNGTEWTQSNITTGKFFSICNAKGLWVTCGNNGIYYSTDGKVWTQSNISVAIEKVIYGNGLWVAISIQNKGMYYSTDGKTWTYNTTINYGISEIAYANGMWIAGPSSSTYLMYSTNGKTWTKSSTNVGDYAVHLSYNNGVWIAVTYAQGVWYSTDGKLWNISNVTSSMGCLAPKYLEDIWIMINDMGSVIYYSTDGKTWVEATNNGIMWIDTPSLYRMKDMWLISGEIGGLLYSIDGKTWDLIPDTEGIALTNVKNANNIFVAYGYPNMDSEESNFCYSFDGITWAPQCNSTTDSTCDFIHNADGIWVASLRDSGLYYSVTWEPTT